ncbi:hypothetical protein YC2023_121535 [Brassica napus]
MGLRGIMEISDALISLRTGSTIFYTTTFVLGALKTPNIITYNPAVRAWRFRVKLHRIYPFYSCVTNSGPYYNYILADEDGYKMEMNTYGNYKYFRGLEKEEGRWVEIFVVDVERAYPCFKTTRSPFRLIASRLTQVRIIEPLNNRLFFDFKSIHAIPRMHWRDLKYPIGK